MNDEAPLMELIVNADPGMNYQWKTAVQAQGARSALSLPALWCFQTMERQGGQGQEPRVALMGPSGAPATPPQSCWKPPAYPGHVQEVLWMQKIP